MAVTNDEVYNWLVANPDKTDAEIVAAMQGAGVSTAQLAEVTGMDLGDVQTRYDAVGETSLQQQADALGMDIEDLVAAKSTTPEPEPTPEPTTFPASFGQVTDYIDQGMTAEQAKMQVVKDMRAAGMTDEQILQQSKGAGSAIEALNTEQAVNKLSELGIDLDTALRMNPDLADAQGTEGLGGAGIDTPTEFIDWYNKWGKDDPNRNYSGFTDANIIDYYNSFRRQGLTHEEALAKVNETGTKYGSDLSRIDPLVGRLADYTYGMPEGVDLETALRMNPDLGAKGIDTEQEFIDWYNLFGKDEPNRRYTGFTDEEIVGYYESLLNEGKSHEEAMALLNEAGTKYGSDLSRIEPLINGTDTSGTDEDDPSTFWGTVVETATDAVSGTDAAEPESTGSGATDYALGVSKGLEGYADITPTAVLTTTDDTKQKVATSLLDTAKDAGVTSIAQAASAEKATAPTVTPAAQAATTTTATGVADQAAKTAAAMGTVSPQAQVAAQVVDPRATEVAQAPQAAQIAQAQQVQAPTPLQATPEMMVSGAVDMAQVDTELAKAPAAAQATASAEATVQGQMAKLMQDFDAANPPAWASGAMRSATAALAERGLGASSMAGQAIIQAAMESALPMAQMDAQTVAQFELQNLSNRQQRAMLLAQQRADFLGQSFDQEFQARVANAAKIADIAQVNFNAATQIALENAQLAQTVDLNNLSNKQARVMAEVAQIANLEMTNLTNRQQAAVLNAQSFLQMDMANLDNLQQTTLFNSQNIIQSLFNDAAAANAAAQFNATSQNQTDQFFASLASQVSQFNATQTNAINQFNADQENIVERFNAEIQNQREQFNVENQLLIDQSNAQWFREVATADTLAQNAANIQSAANMLELTTVALNNIYQQERDTMEYAWQSGENDLQRYTEVAIAKINAEAKTGAANIEADAATSASIGKFAIDVATNWDDVKSAGTDILSLL